MNAMKSKAKKAASAGMEKAAPKRLPVSVGRNDGSIPVRRFATLAEGEAYIEEIAKTDPSGVDAGDYYVDAPEEMVNPPRDAASVQPTGLRRGAESSIQQDGPEFVERSAGDLLPGDMVDLESCPHLKNEPLAEFEYGEVVSVVRESPDCVVVSYEGISAAGYAPDTRLRCLATVNVEGVEVRAINEVREGMRIAFPVAAMMDSDDGDWERFAGPGEVATVGARNADGDWSVAFASSGCWVFLEDEFIRAQAREVLSEGGEAALSGAWGWNHEGASSESYALAEVIPAVRAVLDRYGLNTYSYLTHGYGEENSLRERVAMEGPARPLIRVCIPKEVLEEGRLPRPNPVRTWDEEVSYLGLNYPVDDDWSGPVEGDPAVVGLREDLEALGLTPVRP